MSKLGCVFLATAVLAAGSGCAQPLSADRLVSATAGKQQKREGPAPVLPLRVGDWLLRALPFGLERGLGQNGGYIEALDTISGRQLWTLKVYEVHYNPARETDVQDIFIVEMTLSSSGRLVEVVDELGRRYLVDPFARTVTLKAR